MCFSLTVHPRTFSARYVITAASASYPTQELTARLKLPHGLLPGASEPLLCRSDTLVALQPAVNITSAANPAANALHLIGLSVLSVVPRPLSCDPESCRAARSRVLPPVPCRTDWSARSRRPPPWRARRSGPGWWRAPVTAPTSATAPC